MLVVCVAALWAFPALASGAPGALGMQFVWTNDQGSEIAERPTNRGSQEYFNDDGGYVHDRTVMMMMHLWHDANE